MSTIKFNLADLTGQFFKELKERFGKMAQVEIRVDETGQTPAFSEDLF